MTIVQDALQQHRPPNAKRASTGTGTRYSFDCPVCVVRGHSRDTRQRGGLFINQDGSAGYNCFNCQFATRHRPGDSLSRNMELLLRQLGMTDDAVKKLSFDLWAEKKALQQPSKQPLPSGSKRIGQWIEENHHDTNLADLLADTQDMNPSIRDNYYWTPEAGQTGDMNRRYIWVIGDPLEPDAWTAHSIDEDNPEQIVGDTKAWAAAIAREPDV